MNDTTAISPDLLDDPVLREADAQAVQDFVANGAPLDPAVRTRVRARADRAREANFRRIGPVNIEELLPPSTVDE